MVALALLVVGATFNSVRAQQAPTTRIDSLSYAVGMSQTQGLKEFLSRNMKIDLNYMDDFVKGLKEGAYAEDTQAKAAYYAGIQIGQQVLRQMKPGINKELYGKLFLTVLAFIHMIQKSFKRIIIQFINSYFTSFNGRPS